MAALEIGVMGRAAVSLSLVPFATGIIITVTEQEIVPWNE